jgi:hypothetical protein
MRVARGTWRSRLTTERDWPRRLEDNMAGGRMVMKFGTVRATGTVSTGWRT